jgi:hypothetical protein
MSLGFLSGERHTPTQYKIEAAETTTLNLFDISVFFNDEKE